MLFQVCAKTYHDQLFSTRRFLSRSQRKKKVSEVINKYLCYLI